MFKKNFLDYFYLNLILLFIYIPILSLVIFSFNQTEGRIASLVNWERFGFRWYGKIFSNSAIRNSIIVTFKIAIFSTFISTIIGTLAAISLAQNKLKWQHFILNLNQISFVIPEIIIALALFVFFGFIRLENGFLRMLFAHISFSVPYVLATIFPKCNNFEINLFEAAYDLGANPLQTLIRVVLPQLKSVILAGASLAFALSFDDFIISYFVGGSDYQNISSYIYSLKGTINPAINALSSILILFIFFKIFINYLKLRKESIFK
ncbi:ABC-type spermidine/putrescine transport, permease protein II [Candidatus Phytoplasma mali]|uniref:ABC-type spermidine/putrescine transport, permease protein II n=1 Tax=Phytoplasma mali (strain AT) TaxID=482235 RepID=B3QZU2_PHYMT|nr:ABC transporter permease [Candidatus Phytoplasma mali]CAP18479.1 ABC-type spermidine/putrescine transport, permease protein II [Candidatus Phytoplasma mali]